VHVVGFIIRIYHNARSPERQIVMYVVGISRSPVRRHELFTNCVIEKVRYTHFSGHVC